MLLPLRLGAQVCRSLFFFLRGIHISNWNESDIITDRKSRFQARHTELSDPDEVPAIVEEFIAQHKSIAKNASHPHILAWRTGQKSACNRNEYCNVQQGFKDNGEKGAGAKLLEHLVKQDVMNKLVIVTRWYGGSPIGSLRFRHISNCAFDSLRKGQKEEVSKKKLR